MPDVHSNVQRSPLTPRPGELLLGTVCSRDHGGMWQGSANV